MEVLTDKNIDKMQNTNGITKYRTNNEKHVIYEETSANSPELKLIRICDSLDQALDELKRPAIVDKERMKIEPLWVWEQRK